MYRPPVGARQLDRLPPGALPSSYNHIEARPICATLGVEIGNVDLALPLSDGVFAEIDSAFREWKVLVFRDQRLTAGQLLAFARRWGAVVEDSLPRQVANGGEIVPCQSDLDNIAIFTCDEEVQGLENIWHVDGSYRRAPVLGTMLAAIEVPDIGGDTMFADMAAAFDNLSPADRELADGSWAEHDWSQGGYRDKYETCLDEYRSVVPPVLHPVVIAHPRTGRRTLFVNRGFSTRISGMDEAQGDQLLDRLTRQADVPEYQMRIKWASGMVVFWDNFAVQHYAVNDFWPQRRTMMRATVQGEWATGRFSPA